MLTDQQAPPATRGPTHVEDPKGSAPPADFDDFAENYGDIINRGLAITGESFEYFIGVRLDLVLEELVYSKGTNWPAQILDFGCGVGATEVSIHERFPAATIHGIDPSAESVKKAQALGVPNATFRVSEATTLPYEDGSFDIIYSNGTFHHIDERLHARVLAELARILKPHGSLFIFENNPLNPLTVRAMRQNPFDRGTRMILPWTLQRRVARTGLKARTPRFYVFLPKQLKSLRWTERYLRAVPFGAQYYVRGSKGGG